MTLTKYGHSCVMLEDEDFRLLFDPGTFVFIEGLFKPADLPKPDVVLITHSHLDHYAPDALREIIGDAGTEVITNTELAVQMGTDGFNVNGVDPGEQVERGPFTIDAIEAPHEEMPNGVPASVGFFINDRLLHGGDSIRANVQQAEIVVAPVTAPWATVIQLIEHVLRLSPRIVIPAHDAAVKDFSLQTLYNRHFQPPLEAAGIEFHPLKPGESLELG